jgi:hypothetical protein
MVAGKEFFVNHQVNSLWMVLQYLLLLLLSICKISSAKTPVALITVFALYFKGSVVLHYHKPPRRLLCFVCRLMGSWFFNKAAASQ